MNMIPMSPHPKIPQSLPPIKEEQDLHLRNLWTTFRLKHAKESVTVDESQRDPNIEPRLNQITLSLIATIKNEGVKEKIRAFLREYNTTERGDRYEMFTARVLEGVILAFAWGPVSDRPEDAERVYMKEIAKAINIIVDHQKAMLGEDVEEEDEKDEGKKEDGKKEQKRTKSRKVSDVFQKFLNIKTVRATDGLPQYKGTKYVNMTTEIERLKSLCVRWDVAWQEGGSMTESKAGSIHPDNLWMLKPKELVDFMKSSPETKKLREEWKSMKMEDANE